MIRRLTDNLRHADFSSLLLNLIVVVLGILLDLGADAWWEKHVENDLKREYSLSLQDSLEEDLKAMDERMLPEIEMRIAVSERLQKVTPETVPVTLEDQRAFVRDIDRAGYLSVIQPQRSVIDDLIATGNQHLIDDAALRRSVLDYYELADFWAPYDAWSREVIWGKYRTRPPGSFPSTQCT